MSEDIYKQLVPTPHVRYPTPGRCIYCGAVGVRLTDEHIIPLSLNGTELFIEASCDNCCKITSKFETSIAKETYRTFRLKRGYKTRHKKKKPKKLPLSYIANGKNTSAEIDIVDFPSVYGVVFFPPPGILTNAPINNKNPEMRVNIIGDQVEMDRVLEMLEAESASLDFVFSYGDFLKLLAKIAHGYLVAHFGFDGYEAYLPDLILGKSPYLSHYVGGIGNYNTMHMLSSYVEVVMDTRDNVSYVLCNIHLLGAATMPMYQVVAARVTDFEVFFSNHIRLKETREQSLK